MKDGWEMGHTSSGQFRHIPETYFLDFRVVIAD